MAERATGHNIHDKQAEIPHRDLYPHYSDSRFWERRIGNLTVYLAKDAVIVPSGISEEVKDAAYEYSDRIYQATDFETYDKARNQAKEKIGTDRSAAFFEELLRQVRGDETIEVVHILSGVQISGNGQPYQVFGLATGSRVAS